MAQRWSFEEDCVVCKFCIEKQYRDIEYELLGELVNRLVESGFERRSSPAVYKRAKYFTYLLRGWDAPHAVKQVREIVRVRKNKEENYRWHLWLESFINEHTKEGATEFPTWVFEKSSDLLYVEPLQSLGPTLKEVFFEFVEKKGFSIPDICEKSQVDKSTISRIKKHPEKSISKPTAMCLCFGLRLTLSEAQQLIESAGHKLASNPVDLLVAAYFDSQNYDIFDANDQLCTRQLPLLFGYTKERRKKKTNSK